MTAMVERTGDAIVVGHERFMSLDGQHEAGGDPALRAGVPMSMWLTRMELAAGLYWSPDDWAVYTDQEVRESVLCEVTTDGYRALVENKTVRYEKRYAAGETNARLAWDIVGRVFAFPER